VAGELLVRASGIEVIRFYGFGNATAAPGSDEFYRVTQDEIRVEPSLLLPLAGPLTLTLGPALKYVSTDRRSNRFLATLNPYGVGNFGELGGRAGLRFDTRDRPSAATRGVKLEVSGAVHPDWWDVQEVFGDLSGEALAFLSPKAPLDPTFAFRLGGRKIWGRFPYFESAFIGDRSTVRLGQNNRFAGDALAYGSAELRLTLGRADLVVPTDIGIFGLADVGRVWLKGESSDTWHDAFGGGLSLGFLSRAYTLSVALAISDEHTRVYAQAGFGF
jgi:outer membrane protein assembly factor BamA